MPTSMARPRPASHEGMKDVGVTLEVSRCGLLSAMGDSRRLQALAKVRLNAEVPLPCLVFPAADHMVAETVHRCPTAQGARGPFQRGGNKGNAKMPAEQNSVGGGVECEANRR
jgi:hypothetical protein